MNKTAIDFDITICGGGMVGATLAALIATDSALKGLRIALIEAQVPPPPTDEVEVRVSAISRASERILSRAGAWDFIKPSQRCAYQEMRVWDHASSAPDVTVGDTKSGHGEPVEPFIQSSKRQSTKSHSIKGPSTSSGRTERFISGAASSAEALHFSAASMAEPNLGYIIANNCTQWAALEACARAGITRFNASLSSIDIDTHDINAQARVGLSDGRSFTTRLVIGADGARSASRECMGIATHIKPYQQTALVTHVRTAKPHQFTAWQRFLPDGPMAFLPLNDGRSSIVWTTTPENAERLLKLDDEALAREITMASDSALGDVTMAGPRGAFPLQIAQVDEYCRPRFVLVGDAAHSIHPLAGQGVNLGLMDAASLVQILSEARSSGVAVDALGEMRLLRRYERWRKTENTIALGMIDGINRLFSNDNAIMGTARRLGLKTVERHSMIKRFFMSRALGIAGDAPSIVKG